MGGVRRSVAVVATACLLLAACSGSSPSTRPTAAATTAATRADARRRVERTRGRQVGASAGTSAGVSAAGSAATSPASARAASAASAASATGSTPAASATKVSLQLQWYPQAQFAGYFAAMEQGYYQAENIDLDIINGSATIAPQTVGSASTGPEFIIAWVPKVLQAREVAGAEQLVDIAQIFQRSGTLAVSWKSSNITKPEDFKGKKIGLWDLGNELEVTAGARKAGLEPGKDYTTSIQDFDMTLLLSKQVDVSEAMIYNEYAQLLESLDPDTGELVKPTDLNVINWNDVGTAMLQDALFARESWLEQPGNQDVAIRFLARIVQGLDLLPLEPGGLRPVHHQRGREAGRRPPALDDERDQSADLAVAERDRRHGPSALEADRRDLGRRPGSSRLRRQKARTGPTLRPRPSKASPMTRRAPTSRRAPSR